MSDQLDDLLGKPESHPSYALIGINRLTYGGGTANLFGSSIRHSHTIRLRICRAEKRRNHSGDHYYARDEIVEIEMSPTQFAEAITSFGCGDGVPCTLRRVDRESIEPPVGESKREQFVSEFREHTDEIARKFADLTVFAEALREKASVSKADRIELLNRIARLKQDVKSNLPFVADQFNEQMDKTVGEAKGEIEAFFLHRVLEAGLAKLQEDGVEGLTERAPVAIGESHP